MTPRGRRWLGALAVCVVPLALASCTTSDDAAGRGGASGPASAGGGEHADMAMGAAVPSAGPISPTRYLGPQGRTGQFVTECGYSHSAPDDPIVSPDEPGESHMHDFFGNVTTDAHSTTASLLAGATTCQKQIDTAAYWSPQLRDHGEPVTPTHSVAYYRAAPGVDPASLQPFPEGLKIIAGDMTRTEPLSADLAGWACGVSSTHSAAPPVCPDQAPLRAVITFPDCWDGRHADSADHRSHMANSAQGECPDSHPVHVPQLTFSVLYPIAGEGHDLSLASGSTYGIHADFVNAWDQVGLAREITLCLHRDVVCGLASNRDEEPLFAHG